MEVMTENYQKKKSYVKKYFVQELISPIAHDAIIRLFAKKDR
jgi:hypothetical protein